MTSLVPWAAEEEPPAPADPIVPRIDGTGEGGSVGGRANSKTGRRRYRPDGERHLTDDQRLSGWTLPPLERRLNDLEGIRIDEHDVTALGSSVQAVALIRRKPSRRWACEPTDRSRRIGRHVEIETVSSLDIGFEQLLSEVA